MPRLFGIFCRLSTGFAFNFSLRYNIKKNFNNRLMAKNVKINLSALQIASNSVSGKH